MIRRRQNLTTSVPLIAQRDWLLPYWWDRRNDADGPSYDPVGADGLNTTERRWTLLGVLGSSARGAVDQRGLVWTGANFSLDWWIRANDRWHHPSAAAGVRQNLLDGAPVVETRLRVGKGDVVQRVGGIAGDGGALVIEFENNSDAPVALAVAVRPVTLHSACAIHHVDFADQWLRVDGLDALGTERQPGLVVGGTADGDLAALVMSTDDEPRGLPRLPVSCDRGLAHGVISIPLVHGTSIRFVAPLHPTENSPRSSSQRGSRPSVGAAPELSRVASGWRLQQADGARFVLPNTTWQTTFDHARTALKLFALDGRFCARPMTDQSVDWVDERLISIAHDQMGWHRDAASGLLSMGDSIDRRGNSNNEAGTAAALDALRVHGELSGINATAESLVDTIIGAARYLATSPAGGPEVDFSRMVGLDAAAELLMRIGDAAAASDSTSVAASVDANVVVSDRSVAAKIIRLASPGTPGVLDDAAFAALGATSGPWIQRLGSPGGYDVVTTALVAAHELSAPDRRALDRIGVLVDAASSTTT